MLVTLSEISTLVRRRQPENARSPILLPLVITTVFRFSIGMQVIANAGIVAFSNKIQSSNARAPIVTMLSAIVMLINLAAPLNAFASIVSPPVITTSIKFSFGSNGIAEAGTLMLSKELQP